MGNEMLEPTLDDSYHLEVHQARLIFKIILIRTFKIILRLFYINWILNYVKANA